MTAAVVVSALILAVFAFSAPEAFRAAEATAAGARGRPESSLAAILVLIRIGRSAYAPLVSAGVCGLLAVASLVYVLYSFEKTQAPDIFYFAIFAFSLAVEPLRIALPLAEARGLPLLFSAGVDRTILFGRIFGLAALFISSVHADGLALSKYGASVAIIAIAALTVATGIPMDGSSFDSSLSPWPGYRSAVELLELALALATVLTFVIAAYTRSVGEYLVAAGGIILILIGRDLLVRGDTWLGLGMGIAGYGAGTWLFVSRVHRYYLWL